jgi:hypothetical protein
MLCTSAAHTKRAPCRSTPGRLGPHDAPLTGQEELRARFKLLCIPLIIALLGIVKDGWQEQNRAFLCSMLVVLCISTLFVGQYSKMARAVCDVMFLIAYCTECARCAWSCTVLKIWYWDKWFFWFRVFICWWLIAYILSANKARCQQTGIWY